MATVQGYSGGISIVQAFRGQFCVEGFNFRAIFSQIILVRDSKASFHSLSYNMKCMDEMGTQWDSNQVYEMSKLRVATWAKAKWPHDYGVVLNTYKCPNVRIEAAKVKIVRQVKRWSKPAYGWMKFNVDGATQGCLKEVRIQGVLRDDT
ncbi:Uncharacterized protein TCM_038346 [Theobroma cacao]|uniref:Uncharacterized protein n=1 Tax=Theobroma cacao TaxID=3641 RepID=A0A061GPS3_THECC|nr:Uncharacterized protein TCM_038346 [Theobroma cacao]